MKAPSFYSNDPQMPLYQNVPTDAEGAVEIMFNLNMKHDVFKMKKLETLSKAELRRQAENSFGTEQVTVKDIALIRKHYRRFNISNIGNFHTNIVDVTLSNNEKKSNRFTLTKLSGDQGYEIMYEPDFRHSMIEETILVKTENSITEFKVQAHIPLYLIKFIDMNFRLSEIEEHIGNWYYLIVLSFVLLTLLLLGTELVEYVIFLKQKNINYALLTELISAYEKRKELEEEEQKMKKLSKMLSKNSNEPPHSQSEQKAKKATPVKSLGTFKPKSIPSDESKAGIEEIKKKLVGRIDFNNSKIESVRVKKEEKQKDLGQKGAERQPVAKHGKNKKRKGKEVKVVKGESGHVERRNKEKESEKRQEEVKGEDFGDTGVKRKQEKKDIKDKDSLLEVENKEKEKTKPSEEEKKEVSPSVSDTSPTQAKPDLQKLNPKGSKFKRGKQRNQPKQNKVKDVVVDLSSEQEVVPTNRVVFPSSMYQPVTQMNASNEDEFPSLAQATEKHKDSNTIPEKEETKEDIPSEKQNTEEFSKIKEEKQVKTIKNEKLKEDEKVDPKKQNISPIKPRQVETATIKLYSRQQTEESAASEPKKETRNRLSNAQSNNSWAENDEGAESINPRSEYTDEDRLDDSEDKNAEDVSNPKSSLSQSESSYKESQKSAKKSENKRFTRKTDFQDNKKATSGRQNPYYRNDYNDLKYYKKQYHDPTSYKSNKKGMKKGHDITPKSGNSYQDYKRELREQKNKHNYNRGGYYLKNQQDYYTKPVRAKDEAPNMRRGARGKYREDKAYKTNYYDSKEDHFYHKYDQSNFIRHKKSEPKIEEAEDTKAQETIESKQQDEEPSSYQDSHEDLQNYVEENKDMIQITSENEEEKEGSGTQSGFFEEKDSYAPSQFNMFSAFQNSSRDFSLFSPVQDTIFGEDDQINFSLLNDASDPSHQEEDEVLGRFANLQDLRNQSEIINYDLTKKSFKYRSGYSSKSPE